VEFYLEKDETVRPICEKLMAKGVLAKDTHEKTVRFAPPLVITKADIDWAIERIRPVFEAT
jgi:ornithine--oxo-acid transaminase